MPFVLLFDQVIWFLFIFILVIQYCKTLWLLFVHFYYHEWL